MRKLIIAISIVLLQICSIRIISAATYSLTPLVTDSNYHFNPDISGNNVTYSANTNTGVESFIYNFYSHKTLQLPNGATALRIYKNLVVYTNTDSSGINQIYLYNLNTKTTQQITYDSNYHQEPDIWGNYLVWAAYSPNSNNNIFLYNLAQGTTTQITYSNSTDEFNPSASNYWVTWTSGNGATAAIYAYNLLSQQTKLVVAAPGADHSRSSGNRIVWQDQRQGNNNSDIYTMNLLNNKFNLVSNGVDFCGSAAIADG